jgi:UDP-glucose:(heptosyl)LPS alpha-1,3-glucosyltransferase
MPKPRIALIRQRYKADGGAERFVSRALDALGQSGLNITLIARKWDGGEHFQIEKCDPPYLGRLWRDKSFAQCVCNTVKNKKYDLIQSHERLSCCNLYRAGDGVHREWLKQRSRVLPAWRQKALWLSPYHHYIMSAEKAMFESDQLKAVICNSDMVRKEILSYFAINAEKIHVIYSGVDTEHFHPDCQKDSDTVRSELGVSDEDTVFLFVGSGFERKGLNTFIKALSIMPASVKGLVIGQDKKLPDYEKAAKELGLEERLLFLGKKSDVRPYYGAADALILPTLYDPFPNVILEGMACGLPVLTSTKSGGAEVIEEGKQGYVHDALDYHAFSESMTKLVDKKHAQACGKAARKRISPFTLEKMAIQLNLLYSNLINP